MDGALERASRGASAARPMSREKGGGRREKCVDTMQWASVGKVESREKGGGRSAWMARLSAPRAARPPRVP